MTKKQIDQLTRLLQEAQQLVADLDCGPLECPACVDTDDIAYIELPIVGDGTAKGKAEWTFALEVLVGLAHTDWTAGELYEAFRLALKQTNPYEQPLPDWEDMELLMAEQARLRRIYRNLIPFLEYPSAYAATLTKQVDELLHQGIPRDEAQTQVAANAFKALAEELEMAKGEKATPRFYQMYQAHLEKGGDDIEVWFSRWLATD